jgi:hypothetical protein
MAAYIQDHHTVRRSQYVFVQKLLEGYNSDTVRFFSHHLVCSLLKLTDRSDDAFIPFASELMRSKVPKAEWRLLVSHRFLEMKDYDRRLGLSREFRVPDWVLTKFLDQGRRFLKNSDSEWVDLFTGRRCTKVRKSRGYDENGHNEPKLVRAAMQVLQENLCPYNATAIEDFLRACRDEIENLKRADGKWGEAERRLRVNEACWQAVQQQTKGKVKPGINYYAPSYVVRMSGRIYQVAGGLQTCSREMKQHSYSGIENVSNNDLKASQINILTQFFEEGGTDTRWLVTYRDTEDNKQTYADAAGLPVDVWKACLIAIVMGGHFPTRIENHIERENSILHNLAKVAGGDEKRMKELHGRLAELLQPLAQEMRRWQDWLMKSYVPSHRRRNRKGWYIENAVGKKLYLAELPQGREYWRKRARVTAFLLQGLEAATIHHLTLLGEEYGFRPLANEHDGLIVEGDIPSVAVREAANLSGLKYAAMEKKDFL